MLEVILEGGGGGGRLLYGFLHSILGHLKLQGPPNHCLWVVAEEQKEDEGKFAAVFLFDGLRGGQGRDLGIWHERWFPWVAVLSRMIPTAFRGFTGLLFISGCWRCGVFREMTRSVKCVVLSAGTRGVTGYRCLPVVIVSLKSLPSLRALWEPSDGWPSGQTMTLAPRLDRWLSQ